MSTLREADRLALVKLLADDDPTVLRLLEERFAAMGREGREFLESVLNRPDTGSHRSAKWIFQSLLERNAGEAFARFCATCETPADLGTGCWLLGKTRYPEFDTAPYEARLVGLVQELRERLTGRETPRGTIEVINRHLFDTLGFRGNTRDYHDPDNSYLHRVLDRRLGIPISLSVLYLLVGQRLRLPLSGVNLPGHFMIQWHSRVVRFFIDPFNAGRVLSEDDCRTHCLQMGLEFRKSTLQGASTRQILARMCSNLRMIYLESDPARVRHLERAIALLTSDHARTI